MEREAISAVHLMSSTILIIWLGLQAKRFCYSLFLLTGCPSKRCARCGRLRLGHIFNGLRRRREFFDAQSPQHKSKNPRWPQLKALNCLPFSFFGPLNICRKYSSNSRRVPSTNARPCQRALRKGDSGGAPVRTASRTGGCQIHEAMTALEEVRWSACCVQVTVWG